MFGPNLPDFKPGMVLRADSLAKLRDEIKRLSTLHVGPGLELYDLPIGRGIRLASAAGPAWFKINGTCGLDGGYPWQPVAQLPVIQVTAPGSGYTTATATASGGNGTSAVLVVTVGAAMTPNAGKILAVTPSNDGLGFFTINPEATIAITGDGTGATAVVNGLAWTNTGSAVAGPGGLVYEARGCRSVPADGTPYPATVGPGGQLLFFCRSTYVVKTTTRTSYPTSANAYYACTAQVPGGVETEGGAASYTNLTAAMNVLNIGTTIPPAGTVARASWTYPRFTIQWNS